MKIGDVKNGGEEPVTMNGLLPNRKWLNVYATSPLGAKLIVWVCLLFGVLWIVKDMVITLRPVKTGPSFRGPQVTATNQGAGVAVAIGNTSAPVVVVNKQGNKRQTVEDLLEAQRLSNAVGFTNPTDQLSRQTFHPVKDDDQPQFVSGKSEAAR